MNESIKMFNVVALTIDFLEHTLKRGSVGTVVESLADGSAFEVEFSDSKGETYASLRLNEKQLIILHYDPFTENINIVA